MFINISVAGLLPGEHVIPLRAAQRAVQALKLVTGHGLLHHDHVHSLVKHSLAGGKISIPLLVGATMPMIHKAVHHLRGRGHSPSHPGIPHVYKYGKQHYIRVHGAGLGDLLKRAAKHHSGRLWRGLLKVLKKIPDYIGDRLGSLGARAMRAGDASNGPDRQANSDSEYDTADEYLDENDREATEREKRNITREIHETHETRARDLLHKITTGQNFNHRAIGGIPRGPFRDRLIRAYKERFGSAPPKLRGGGWFDDAVGQIGDDILGFFKGDPGAVERSVNSVGNIAGAALDPTRVGNVGLDFAKNVVGQKQREMQRRWDLHQIGDKEALNNGTVQNSTTDF